MKMEEKNMALRDLSKLFTEMVFIRPGFGEALGDLPQRIKQLFCERLSNYSGLSESFEIGNDLKPNSQEIRGLIRKPARQDLLVELDEYGDKSTLRTLSQWGDALIESATIVDNNRVIVNGPAVAVIQASPDKSEIYQVWVFESLHFNEIDTGHHGYTRGVEPSEFMTTTYAVRLFANCYMGGQMKDWAKDVLDEVKALEERGETWDYSLDQLSDKVKDLKAYLK
jgi:hypothetical protein